MQKSLQRFKHQHPSLHFSKRSLLPVLVVGIVGVVLLSHALYQVFYKKQDIDSQVTSLKEEAASLDTTNEDLRRFIEYLKTPDYVQKEARSKLGMKFPGEEVIVITDGSVSAPQESKTPLLGTLSHEDGSNPLRWWKYFFGAR